MKFEAVKVQIRRDSDGDFEAITLVRTPSGELLQFVDSLTGPEPTAEVIKNHLDSAEKIYQAQIKAASSK